MRKFTIYCMLFVLAPLNALATFIPTSTGTPSSRNVALDRGASVNITWRFTITGATSPATQVSSGSYSIVSSIPTITVSKPLLQSFPSTPFPTNRTVIVAEAIFIPQNILYQIYKSGSTSFIIRRTFTDDTPASSGPVDVSLTLTGSGASGFAINTVSLRFDDNSARRVVPRSSTLGVAVKMNYTGAGMCEAVWEIAEPTSTFGQPVFRPIYWIRQYQGGGGGETRITGPSLPTAQTGLHLIRLRFTAPMTEFSPPTIKYYVYDKGKRPRLAVDDLQLISPGAATSIGANTQFQWQRITGASSYRVEFYAEKTNPMTAQLPSMESDNKAQTTIDEPLVSGIMVPGDKQSVTLPITAKKKLIQGRWYYWRVAAFDKNGARIAVSDPRKILMPSH